MARFTLKGPRPKVGLAAPEDSWFDVVTGEIFPTPKAGQGAGKDPDTVRKTELARLTPTPVPFLHEPTESQAECLEELRGFTGLSWPNFITLIAGSTERGQLLDEMLSGIIAPETLPRDLLTALVALVEHIYLTTKDKDSVAAKAGKLMAYHLGKPVGREGRKGVKRLHDEDVYVAFEEMLEDERGGGSTDEVEEKGKVTLYPVEWPLREHRMEEGRWAWE